MIRKRFAKAALASVLAVSMAATATNWVAPNAFVDVVQAEGKTSEIIIKVTYVDENGTNRGGGDVFVTPDENNHIKYESLDNVPKGYEVTQTGDMLVQAGGEYTVTVKRSSIMINVAYVDENGTNLGGGDVFVTPDENNHIKYESLDNVPEGYEATQSGDMYVEAGGHYTVTVKRSAIMINVVYVDGNGNNIGGGDVFVTPDANNHIKYESLDNVPEGYEVTQSGDMYVEAGGYYTVPVKKIVTSTTLHFVFVDEEGNNLGGGDYVVDQDGDGIFNWSEVQLPEGYKLIVSGDAFVKDYASGINEVVVEKIAKASIINVTFVDAAGNVLGGGDFFVDADGDGIFNLSEIEAPAGYKTTLTGDQFVSDYVDGKTVTVEKINKGTIINVVYKDAQGRNLGGGDYIVDLDGDGIANYSELPLPEGYQLTETGDFFVNEGTSYTVTLKRAGAAIIHVQFVSEGGKVLGGGDYFVDADGDGIANYSELTLPEGYELIETGDFFVDTDKDYVITVSKIIEGTIINVVYVDKDGNVLGGGDYFVDVDDDGIANYSELTLPEGYELIVTGDFFVNPNHSYTIELQKIQKGTMINVVFEDEEGNHLGGGDYIVDEDGDGIANYSELDLPVGYELIVTGDFFVEEGESYTIVLKMRETVLTVTFEDTEGNVVDTVTLKAGQPGSPEETYAFVLGEHFNLPEGYQLAEGVDQVTTIEIPYGSVGGHTMIVEKIAEEPGETPEEPTDPEKPGETPDDPDVTVDPSEPTDTPETSEPAETDDTPKTGDTMMMPYYAAFGAGISLLAMLLLVRRRLVK